QTASRYSSMGGGRLFRGLCGCDSAVAGGCACDAAAGGFAFAAGWDHSADFAETHRRHAGVDSFVLAGGDAERFVPDTDVTAAAANVLVKRHPRRPVRHVLAARIRFEVLE